MQIKQAPEPSQSQVLSAANKSNLITLGLFGVCAALAVAWSYVPEKSKTTIMSIGSLALGGGLTGIRFYNKAIEDGRFDIGDLDRLVATRALFTNAETGRLALVKDFVEGNVDLHQLDAVKEAIAAQAAAVVPTVDLQQMMEDLYKVQFTPPVTGEPSTILRPATVINGLPASTGDGSPIPSLLELSREVEAL